jgi:putative Holliday junction resolvase
MTSDQQIHRQVLAFDVGERRIGIAQADTVTRIPYPLTTVTVDGLESDRIRQIVAEVEPMCLVVGLPRNQSGETTAQSQVSQAFAEQLEKLSLPVVMQDESLTSVLAEKYLKESKKPYTKEDIDARAAALILDDYLKETYGY